MKFLKKIENTYSSRISYALSLIKETKIFFQGLGEKKTMEDIYNEVMNDNLFDKTALESRKKAFSAIKNRFYSNPKVNNDILIKIINSHLDDSIKNQIIYYYFSKSECIVYDITTKLLYNMFLEGKLIITKNDILDFLESQNKTHKEIKKWTESTKEHIIQHYLAIMKDFGFLKGSIKKQFNVPFIPPEIILFIVFEKLEMKKNINQILNSDDFKLFFLEKDDLIHYLEEGAKMGYFRFNHTKDIYDLNNMGMTLEAFVDAITR